MPEQKPSGLAASLRPYVTGGSAACFASFCIHPIDVTKVRLQVVPPPATAVSVASGIMKAEGVSGLYAGLSSAILRQATYGTARIGLHTAFSEELKRKNGGSNIPFWQKFVSSFLSGAIASTIGNPFDVVLVRMQADTSKPVAERYAYKGVGDALTRVVREEGFAALYRGYPPTLLRAIAMNVGQMTTYDEAKERFEGMGMQGLSLFASASVVSSVAATFLSLPFDMMKTRLQNMQPDPKTGELPYKHVGDCAAKILRNEGLTRFWRGYTAYFVRCCPHGLIILVSREYIVEAYNASFGLS